MEMNEEYLTTSLLNEHSEHLHLLTTTELCMLLTVITSCLYERGVFNPQAATTTPQQTSTPADDLDDEFDEIDEELDRAKIQRWLIVVLNIALSILIEVMF
jgi:hypothetical protein